MKKFILTGLVVAVASVGLVGCGAKEDDGSNVVSQEAPQNAPLKPTTPGSAGAGPAPGGGAAGSQPASGSGQLPPPP